MSICIYELSDHVYRMDIIIGGSILSSFARNGSIGFDIVAYI
ncbi:hypothetical protein [Brachyspira innocens]|nr:hypothetical protein [Brachyspira innocens]